MKIELDSQETKFLINAIKGYLEYREVQKEFHDNISSLLAKQFDIPLNYNDYLLSFEQRLGETLLIKLDDK